MVDGRRDRHRDHADELARPDDQDIAENRVIIGFSDIPEASQYATSVDIKFMVLTVLSGLVALLVFGLVIFFAMRYRRGSLASRAPLPNWMHRDLEIGWTTATAFTFLFIFWWMATAELGALTHPTAAAGLYWLAIMFALTFNDYASRPSSSPCDQPAFSDVNIGQCENPVR